jgi:hypothetical protein
MKDNAANQPAPLPEDEGGVAPAGRGEILLYQTDDGRTRVECRFQDDTIWLSQAIMAELFQKDVRTINEHLQGIYEEGELEPGATIRKFRIVRREGNRVPHLGAVCQGVLPLGTASTIRTPSESTKVWRPRVSPTEIASRRRRKHDFQR